LAVLHEPVRVRRQVPLERRDDRGQDSFYTLHLFTLDRVVPTAQRAVPNAAPPPESLMRCQVSRSWSSSMRNTWISFSTMFCTSSRLESGEKAEPCDQRPMRSSDSLTRRPPLMPTSTTL